MARKPRMKFEILTRHEAGPFDRKKSEETEELSMSAVEAVCHALQQKGDCRIRAIWRDPETGDKITRDFSSNPRGREVWKGIIQDRETLNKERQKSREKPKPAPIPAWPWIDLDRFKDWHGFLEFAQEHGILPDDLTGDDLLKAEADIRLDYDPDDVPDEPAPVVHDTRHAPSLTTQE